MRVKVAGRDAGLPSGAHSETTGGLRTNSRQWLLPFLHLNILVGLLAFAGLALYQALGGTGAVVALNLAVAALFYSYLFWLAEVFTRPAAGGRRSGSV
ncbi:MAG TPA: hypothetical protein VK971_05520 [Thiohalobacter sp.]|nr:hypothetical protein [Thiohalobacter sp.]